jgi:hypothetical protein
MPTEAPFILPPTLFFNRNIPACFHTVGRHSLAAGFTIDAKTFEEELITEIYSPTGLET